MIRAPLGVRIKTSTTDQVLQGEIDDLSFRKLANGGDASSGFRLARRLDQNPGEIEPYAPIWIYDLRNGRQCWVGRMAGPGRSAGSDGEFYAVTGEGPSAYLRDRTTPLIYVDTDLSAWEKFGGSIRSGQVGPDETAAGTQDGLKVGFQGGTLAPQGTYVDGRNLRINNAGLHLASISYAVTAGANSTTFFAEAYAYPSETQLDSRDLSTSSSGTLRFTLDDWDFPGDTRVHLRIYRDGADATPDSNAFILHTGLVMRSTLYAEYGLEFTDGSDYSNDFVYAWEIVADVLGRLGQGIFDGADAFIDSTGTHQITQLAYPQGTTGAGVLDDVAELEPAYTWKSWQRLDNGLFRFFYTAKPTTVRYETDAKGGLEDQSDSVDLYNECVVRWRDSRGRPRTTIVTSDVPELTARGLTRSYALDLSDQVGSSGNATRAGQQFLAEHATAGNAARLIISEPILDIQHGRTVMPWEIEPDALIRVRGINARPDSLQAATRDGSTVYWIAETEFQMSTCSCSLSLDSYSVTTARAIADLRDRLYRGRR